jgi:hypothetical protein
MVPGGQSADQVRPGEYLNGTDSQADSPRLQFKTVRRRPEQTDLTRWSSY